MKKKSIVLVMLLAAMLTGCTKQEVQNNNSGALSASVASAEAKKETAQETTQAPVQIVAEQLKDPEVETQAGKPVPESTAAAGGIGVQELQVDQNDNEGAPEENAAAPAGDEDDEIEFEEVPEELLAELTEAETPALNPVSDLEAEQLEEPEEDDVVEMNAAENPEDIASRQQEEAQEIDEEEMNAGDAVEAVELEMPDDEAAELEMPDDGAAEAAEDPFESWEEEEYVLEQEKDVDAAQLPDEIEEVDAVEIEAEPEEVEEVDAVEIEAEPEEVEEVDALEAENPVQEEADDDELEDMNSVAVSTPSPSKSIVDSYGYSAEGYSNLSVVITEGTAVQEDGYISVDAVYSEPVTVPSGLQEGDTVEVVMNKLTGETWHLTLRDGSLYPEENDYDEFYYWDTGEGDVTLFQDSDDRVDRPVYEGPMWIRNDATDEVEMEKIVNSVTADRLNSDGGWFNAVYYDENGYATRLVYIGD